MTSHQLKISSPKVKFIDVSITGTDSAAIDLNGGTLVGIVRPASLASTTITPKVSSSLLGTYVAMSDDEGAAYTITVDSSAGYTYIHPIILSGVRFLKLTMGSSETSKTLTLAVIPIS